MSIDHPTVLADAAFEGLAIHDTGTILVANRALGEMLGCDPATLIGKSLAEFVVPECRRWFTAALRSDDQPTEISFMRSDGSRFHAEIRCRELHTEQDDFHTLAVRDMTRHVAVREALRRSQVHLEAAQAQAELGSWEFFPETRTATWSRGLFRLFGLDPADGEPTLEGFLELIHPDDRDPVQAAQRDGLAGHPTSVEFRTNPDRGAIRYLSGTTQSIRNVEGRITHLAGTVQDITNRKHPKSLSTDGEPRYRQLFHQAPIGIGLADDTGQILEFNAALLTPGGYRREDIAAIGNVSELYADPSVRDSVLDLLRREGHVRQHEVKFKRRDGTVYDAALSLVPVTLDDKQRVLAMVEDITQRKAFERALRESETRFRALTEKSYEVIAMFGPEGTLRYISPSVKRVLGYQPEDLIGRTGPAITHPDDLDEANAMFARALREPGSVVEMTHRLRHADGTYRTMQILGRNLLDEPGVNAMVSNFRDVTAQRRAEQDLRRSEAKYRAIFDQASFGIFQASPDGSFLTVNQTVVQLLGYDSAQELLALDARTDVYVDITQWQSLAQEYEQTGSPTTAEVQWKRKDDTVITVRLSGRVVDQERQAAGFLMMAEDVTEQRALEEQLLQAQKMEAVGQLTAGIAHDFNNLLTAVLGRAELLATNLSPRESVLLDDVDQIRDAAIRGAEMVKKLLAFSRKEGFRFEALDLSQLCCETSQMLQIMLPESIDIKVETASKPAFVRGDRGAIQQILMNLATNAADAMLHGGTLTVAVQHVRADTHPQGGHEGPDDAYVRLSVSDTGIGMDDVTRERIFDPFFTTKGVGVGTGLGMSMIYGIVKQHHGLIDVASALGHGTTVSIYLPSTSVQRDVHVPAAMLAPRGGTETILVVEDNEPIRRVAARILQSAGYEVRLARDGAEAINILEGHEPAIDLVITDVVMPKVGGPELYERAQALGSRTAFIFTSGYSEFTHANLHQNAPFVPMLNKPWSTDDLKRCVRDTLDGRVTPLLTQ